MYTHTSTSCQCLSSVSVPFLPMQVLVTAQVIESSKGHPLLKDGVHVISHQVEDESEWPGHSSH